MELALDRPQAAMAILITGVSILVFVELALDRYSPDPDRMEKLVSILVFVELALDLSFSGSRSSR